MASLIWFSLTGNRYWSYRVAIGLPVLSVTVVTSGGGRSARCEDAFSTPSPPWLAPPPGAPPPRLAGVVGHDAGGPHDREEHAGDEPPREQAEADELEQTIRFSHEGQAT